MVNKLWKNYNAKYAYDGYFTEDNKLRKHASIISNKSIKIKTEKNSHVMIYIVHGKVTSITQNSPIDEFLGNDTELRKFVIIKEPSKKTFKQISENYP